MTAADETPARYRKTEHRNERRPADKPQGEPRRGRVRERLQDVSILLDVTRRLSGRDSLDEILEVADQAGQEVVDSVL